MDQTTSHSTISTALSNAERLARLRLIRSDNIGPITFRHLLAKFGSAENALEAIPALAQKGGRKKPIKIYPKSKAEKEVEAARAFGARFIIYGDNFYPHHLAQLEDAPAALLAKGSLHLTEKPAIAMVGARNASAAGCKIARTLAAELGEAGIIITSGLARGIDENAHVGSLKTGSIAVLGTGLDVYYPRENRDLQDALFAQGLVLSEHPLATKPQASHFPRRNRIISGLSLGVIVVEAAPKSGSLITARLANEQGREVFAIPGSPLDPRAKGANSLIKQGATLVESAEDILDHVASLINRPMAEPDLPLFDAAGMAADMDTTADMQETLLHALSHVPVPFDEILRMTDLSAAEGMSLLLELELAGRIIRYPGNMISLAD